MCLYLARADRVVVGADLTRASLLLGAAAAARFRLDRVLFVETDLQRPGSGGRVRRGLLFRRRAPHAGPARLIRAARRAGAARRERSCSASTTRSRASRCGCDGSRRGSRDSAFVPFDPVLRDRAHDRHGGRPGCAISTGILKNTATRSPKCSAGLRRIASSICALIRVRCSATSRRSLFAPAARQLASRRLAGADRMDGHARARRRAVFHHRAQAVTVSLRQRTLSLHVLFEVSVW